jgi:CheY-like chemotaxis protein
MYGESSRQTTVLLVEDNEILREALRDLIEALHPEWRVVEAENGLRGLELAQRAQPDVIVLDFNMPVMNGYEMALHLQQRSETRQIPLVLNSSEDANNPFIVRLRAMCRAVLNKPFSLYDIEYVFNEIFAQPARPYRDFAPRFQAALT